jgi:hypothetical protein
MGGVEITMNWEQHWSLLLFDIAASPRASTNRKVWVVLWMEPSKGKIPQDSVFQNEKSTRTEFFGGSGFPRYCQSVSLSSFFCFFLDSLPG